MSINDKYKVKTVPQYQTKSWLLNKHYAKRVPSISYSFGLYDDDKILQGVCTFGFPPNQEYNNGACVFANKISVLTLELNRLVVNDGLPKNTLSYFVSGCLKLLPKPSCIVSYADPNNGHHGYIYQATNWIYTGTSTPKFVYTFEDGSTFDIRRGIDKKGKIIKRERVLSTHRYFKFLGNKKQAKEMLKNLKYEIKPYPKGDNKRYDTTYKPSVQKILI